VLLSLYSSRTPPRILLKPPVEVTAHTSLQILTPIQYVDTFLGKKLTVEVKYTAVIYLKEMGSDERFRVMEVTTTFMHIIEPGEELKAIIDTPPDNLPREIVEQLVAATIHKTIPILVTLFEKHMVPIALPFKIEVKIETSSAKRKEDN